MSESISATYQYLLTHYGPLMTLKHVAEVMHASPNGLRMSIVRKREPFAAALAKARRKLGRRVYFEARRVAEVIDQDATTAATPDQSNSVTEVPLSKPWPRRAGRHVV